jgi:hypothetical protein
MPGEVGQLDTYWEGFRAGMADMDARHDSCTAQTSSTESAGRHFSVRNIRVQEPL